MIARTHDVAAITLLAAIVLSQPLRTVTLATAIAALIANQLGGIAPDIDQPTAPFWRNLPIGGIFGKFVGKMMGGHRFLSHSLIGLFLFGIAAELLLSLFHPIMPKVNTDLVWWAFMIGVVSHLIMDSFTKEGVPWLLPIPIKFGFPPIKHLRVTTGKGVEKFIVLPVLIGIGIWLFTASYMEISSFVHGLRQ
jgi:membrane-bound metal-dependent hydrolase YbcI (DUF457 family)